MHFPKFWRLAKKGGVSAWGWSDISVGDALTDGLTRVDRIIEWLRTGMSGERGRYGYPNRPMREEVVREFCNSTGNLTAAISRNSYGCLVLNTAEMLFVDVDETGASMTEWLTKRFRPTQSFEAKIMSVAENWIASHPEWGWRVYRTRAGIRLIATHSPILPKTAECLKAFKEFRADRLYQKLCVNQNCFRARLTPKPWRCGIERLSARWPYLDKESADNFEAWNRRYLSASQNHGVCRFMGHFGNTEIHPELRELVLFHDEATRIQSGLPLA